MKCRLVNVPRRPPWPAWAVAIVALWLSLEAATVLLGRVLHHPVRLCLFKRLTGIACPTCGFTRGALSLLHGQPIRAWLYNPLLFTVLALFFTAVAVRIVFARSLRIQLTPRQRKFAWIVAIIFFCANWLYVALCVG